MIRIICDRCGDEVKQDKDNQNDDNFIRYGYVSSLYSEGILYPKSLDICKDCMIEFRRWLKHD